MAKKYNCKEKGCEKSLKSASALRRHVIQKHPAKPAVPEEKPVHRSYIDLIDSNEWGQEATTKDFKHPTDRMLTLGYLAKIVRLLESIECELKRPRTIR